MKAVQLICFGMLTAAIAACSGDNPAQHDLVMSKETYTCPMHPEVVSDEPGNCPKCNMKLVLSNENKASDIDYMLRPTNEYVLSEIKTVKATRLDVHDVLQASGTVAYDPGEIQTVSSRVSGRIEKLYVKYEFEPVKKGQKLMDIFSEELVTEQENYIFLLAQEPDNKNLLKAAEDRLTLLGMSQSQIASLRENRASIQSITITSPCSGHLHAVSQNENSNSDAGQSMAGMSSGEQLSTDNWLREGAYVSKGESIFSIYSTKKVWIILDIPAHHLDKMESGLPVKIWFSAEEKDTVYSRISYVEPELNEQSNTLRVRIYLANSDDKYKIGTILSAEIDLGVRTGNFIPKTAVLNTGHEHLVFVKEGNVFVARTVQTGMENGEFVEIISGIDREEEVASNAQMMVDSESFVKVPAVQNKN